MAHNHYKPEEVHREEIVSLFIEISSRKAGKVRGASRGEMVKAIRSLPDEYPELNAISDVYLKSHLTKILNSDPCVSPDPVWRKVWILNNSHNAVEIPA